MVTRPELLTRPSRVHNSVNDLGTGRRNLATAVYGLSHR